MCQPCFLSFLDSLHISSFLYQLLLSLVYLYTFTVTLNLFSLIDYNQYSDYTNNTVFVVLLILLVIVLLTFRIVLHKMVRALEFTVLQEVLC